jgi:hypothetical protein
MLGITWIGGGIITYFIAKRIIVNPNFKGHKTGIGDNDVIVLCSKDYPNHSGVVWRVTATSITSINSKNAETFPFSHIQNVEMGNDFITCTGFVARNVTRHVAGDLYEAERETKLEILAQIEFSHDSTEIARAIYECISNQQKAGSFQFQFGFQSQSTSFNGKQ